MDTSEAERFGPLDILDGTDECTAIGLFMASTNSRPLAAMLLQYIAARLHFGSRVVKRDGDLWVMAARSFVARKLHMRENQVRTAETDLLKLDLIVKKVIASVANVPRTHYALTVKGKNFVEEIARRQDRENHQVHVVKSTKCSRRQPPSALGDRGPNNQNIYKKEDEEKPSLALTRERSEPRSEKRNLKDNETGPRKKIEKLWREAMKKHRPDLPCSTFTGPKLNFAQQVADALAEDAPAIIDLVVSEWSSFLSYLVNERRVNRYSTVPDIAALATYADHARHWALMPTEENKATGWEFEG